MEYYVSAEINDEVLSVLYGKISKILSKKFKEQQQQKKFKEQKNVHYKPHFILKGKQGKIIIYVCF